MFLIVYFKQNMNLKIQMLVGKEAKSFFERFFKNITSLVFMYIILICQFVLSSKLYSIFLLIADDVEKSSAEFRTCEKYIQNLDFNRFQIKALLQAFDYKMAAIKNTDDEHI